MRLHHFVSTVASLRFQDTFNPYSDRCSIYDRNDAPCRRSEALSRMVIRAENVGVDSIWVGRDLGYRGGRRTGMALTDDVHMECHARRWNFSAKRPTVGKVVAERTASVVWGMLSSIDARVFLWNVFPLHPHEADAPFTNRQHNAAERRTGEEILSMLIQLLRPTRVVAIGNDAGAAVTRVSGSTPTITVRHPSYGGQRQFERQVGELYELNNKPILSVHSR